MLALRLGKLLANSYIHKMPETRHSFVNDKDGPIYISVEIWPECFELEPGEKLTMVWNAPENSEAAQIHFINERELVVWPQGDLESMEFLINGIPARDRSWAFKRK